MEKEKESSFYRERMMVGGIVIRNPMQTIRTLPAPPPRPLTPEEIEAERRWRMKQRIRRALFNVAVIAIFMVLITGLTLLFIWKATCLTQLMIPIGLVFGWCAGSMIHT